MQAYLHVTAQGVAAQLSYVGHELCSKLQQIVEQQIELLMAICAANVHTFVPSWYAIALLAASLWHL